MGTTALQLNSNLVKNRPPWVRHIFAGSVLSILWLYTGLAVAQGSIEFEVPLVINKGLSGNVNAAIITSVRGGESTTEVRVPISRLKHLFKKYANEEQMINWFGLSEAASDAPTDAKGTSARVPVSAVKLSDTSAAQMQSAKIGTISLYQLRGRGLEINFDSSLLSISTTIPRLGTQSISLRGDRQPVPENNYAQARFSSGLNVRASNSYEHRDNGTGQRGLGGTSADLDGFTSFGGFGGWSAFYSANYDETSDKSLARQDVTLIHDNFKHGVRYSLGDFTPNAIGLQSSPSLFGLNIERRYNEINPFRNVRPSGRSRFTLDRDALVSFEVNGTIVETRELAAGDYSIDDFPLTFGENSVRIYVDDGTSNVEVANFSAFSDLDLLAPGLSNFGISIGTQRELGVARNRRYESEPTAQAFYERGISENLTLGVQAEYRDGNALIGSTAVYGTRVGLISIEAAASSREGFDNAYSSILNYRRQVNVNDKWNINAELQFDYQSRDFGGITTTDATDPRWGLRGVFGISRAGYNLNVNGTLINVDDLETRSFSTRLSKSFGRFDLSLDYRYSQTDGRASNDNITFNISSRIGRSSVRGQYQTVNEQYRLGWNGATATDAGELALSQVILTRDPELSSAQVNANYINPRFISNVTHFETQTSSTSGNNGSTTDFSIGSAIGFADGKFAFGRPFTDGFVILDPHDNLRGKKVSVTRGGTEGNIVTSTKRLSSTLVPLSGSYRQQRLGFEVDDLPLGYDIGSGEVEIFPGFLAGYRYRVGSDAANTVIGNVLWPDRTAPSLIVGSLIPINGGDEITVFTNKTGRFVAERAVTGTYRLVFNDGERDFSAEIEVLADGDEPGLVQVGTVVLEEAQ